MLILTSIRSEIATDEDLKDTSFENEENNDGTNELDLKTENVTDSDHISVENTETSSKGFIQQLEHDENEIDIKSNNIVDGDDVTGPTTLPIPITEYSQHINTPLSFQIKNESDNLESSFIVTDTRTDTLYTDVVKEELNISADEHTDIIEDINEEQDNLNLDISQVSSKTSDSQVKEEINQDFDNEQSNTENNTGMFIISGIFQESSHHHQEGADNFDDADFDNEDHFENYSITNENGDYEVGASAIKNDKETRLKSIKCNICSKTFQYRKSLMKHKAQFHEAFEKLTQENIKRLQCAPCSKTFKYRRSFDKHMLEAHGIQKHDQRQIKSTKSKESLKDENSCDTCQLSFPNSRLLDVHKKNVHNMVEEKTSLDLECPICSKQYFSRKSFEKHVEKHKDSKPTCSENEPSSRWTCQHCNIAMTSRARLRLHQNKCQKSASSEIRFECDICKQSFKKQISLKKHKEESHVNKFSSKVIMSASSKSKSAAKNDTSDIMEIDLSDDDCVDVDNSSDIEPLDEDDDISVVNTIMITPQQKIILPKNVILSKEVENRTKSMFTKSSVAAFRERRDVKEVFNCDLCSKQFLHKNSLDQHLKEHLKCTNCSRLFPTARDLTIHHIKCHTQEDCNRCEICNVCFTSHSKLFIAHQKKNKDHSLAESCQSNLLICPTCRFKFITHEALREHKKIHSPATTYACEICLEKFFTPASLDVHKVWEHSVPPRDDALQKLVDCEYYNKFPASYVDSKGVSRYLCKICESSSTKTIKQFKEHKLGFQHGFMRRAIYSPINNSIHKKLHSTWKYHHCSFCKHSFINAAMLKSHISTYHDPSFSLEEIDAKYIQEEGCVIEMDNGDRDCTEVIFDDDQDFPDVVMEVEEDL